MNLKRLSWTALGLALVLGGCTVSTLSPPAAKGRVFITAGRALPAGVKPAKAPAKGLARTAHRNLSARVLDAATDITSLTYTLTNLDTKETVGPVSVNLSSLAIDLVLVPGDNYRIVVDVAITSTASGSQVGVTRYGDQADFTDDPYYDTYVDLYVHPTIATVFDPASVKGTTAATVDTYIPGSTARAATPTALFGAKLTASPADQFFFSPDAKLFYFNKDKYTVFQ